MKNKNTTAGYFLVTIIATIFTALIHEFAHWIVSESFGYDTIMTLNRVSTTSGEHPSELHRYLTTAAGPLITLIQATLAFWLLKSDKWNKYIYPFLFSAFYMRLLAGIMNVININDEGRISAFLQIGTYTLPAIVSGYLFYLVYKISKKHHLNWKFQLITTFIVMVVSSIMILSDQFFDIRLL
ncbi:MAG: hypothetical protein FH748_14305 [Balneolaceae bacterium]|nr:hypothetical protein [Balneolaceae bacterium]